MATWKESREGMVRPGIDPFSLKNLEVTGKHTYSVMVGGALIYHGTGKLVVLLRSVTMKLLHEHLRTVLATVSPMCFNRIVHQPTHQN